MKRSAQNHSCEGHVHLIALRNDVKKKIEMLFPDGEFRYFKNPNRWEFIIPDVWILELDRKRILEDDPIWMQKMLVNLEKDGRVFEFESEEPLLCFLALLQNTLTELYK